jgi:CheY-like chemotaxis protein/HPt (histidine-containing phosphotransfer) domain-containing protein
MFLATVRSLLSMHDAERSLAMGIRKADAVNDAKTHVRVVDAESPAQPVETAGAQEAAVFDVADLCDRLGGDREAVRDILNLFLADVQTDVDQLDRGARERDTQQVMRQAHSLKGTLANVGAVAAQRAAAALEVAGKREDWSAMRSGIDDLKSAIASARHAIREAADRLTDELESSEGTKRNTEMAGLKGPAAPRQTATGPVRAIICDDSVAMRHSLIRMLEGFPVEVVGQAGNPDEAFRLADKLLPELVFLDVVMPGGSGIDVLRRLRAPPHPPMVVMLSSVAERATVVECRQLGAADYLLKPFDATTLKACIERVHVKLRGK